MGSGCLNLFPCIYLIFSCSTSIHWLREIILKTFQVPMSRFDPNNPINYENMDKNLKIVKDR